jgi:hypothetical protein
VCIPYSGNVFTDPLPSNDWRDTYTDGWEEFIKYALEMGSGAMLYAPSFIKTGSGIQMLIGRTHKHTDIETAWLFLKSTFIFFFKIRKVSQKYVYFLC